MYMKQRSKMLHVVREVPPPATWQAVETLHCQAYDYSMETHFQCMPPQKITRLN